VCIDASEFKVDTYTRIYIELDVLYTTERVIQERFRLRTICLFYFPLSDCDCILYNIIVVYGPCAVWYLPNARWITVGYPENNGATQSLTSTNAEIRRFRHSAMENITCGTQIDRVPKYHVYSNRTIALYRVTGICV